jgi:hypothetical protein
VCYGTQANPLPYNMFASLLRPLLLAEYERARAVYSKTVPVLALSAEGGNPFAEGSGETFRLRNIAPSLDAWDIERQHFLDNYRDAAAGVCWRADATALAPGSGGGGGDALRQAVRAALRAASEAAPGGSPRSPSDSGGGDADAPREAVEALSAEHWTALPPLLRAEATAAGPHAAWWLALPRNHVVAVELSEDVLSERLKSLNMSYVPGARLYREETYARAVPFIAGDFLVSDVASAPPRDGGERERAGGSSEAVHTADGAWVFKSLARAKRGEMLITRTIDRTTFGATYARPEP